MNIGLARKNPTVIKIQILETTMNKLMLVVIRIDEVNIARRTAAIDAR